MTLDFTLPKAHRWDAAENYAENLRVSPAGVCSPVGLPGTLLPDAGERTFLLPSGSVLSVGDDFHEVCLDGVPVGGLGAPLEEVMGVGDDTVLFTSAGPEWMSGGELQGTAARRFRSVSLTAEPVGRHLSVDVVLPALAGSYPRSVSPLADDDCRAAARAFGESMELLRQKARAAGEFVQPLWAAWRMVGDSGRVLACGAPERFGELQGASPLVFTALRSASGLQVSRPASLAVDLYAMHLRVPRDDSDFWRAAVRRLEVVVWTPLEELLGMTGAVVEKNSQEVAVNVTPSLRERGLREVEPQVVWSVDFPLEGVDVRVDLSGLWAPTLFEEGDPLSAAAPAVSVAYASGSFTAFGLIDAPGVLALSRSDDPLNVVARHKVCAGRILRICSPMGNAGGWNYARQHLLVFATDGIFSVSVDSSLSRATSSLLLGAAVAPVRDCVAVSGSAVYAVLAGGEVVCLTGARCSRLRLPMAVSGVGWCAPMSELWCRTSSGVAFTLDSGGGMSLRTDLAVRRFVGGGLLVDGAGALRDCTRELPAAVCVAWRRRFLRGRPAVAAGLMEWMIDARRVSQLRLALLVDGGGAPQRLVEVEVNGAVNSPLRVPVRLPARPWLGFSLRGWLTPPARLSAVTLTAADAPRRCRSSSPAR